MSIAERILLSLSRPPRHEDHQTVAAQHTIENALDALCGDFPGFLEDIHGRTVLDFGCGGGYQAVAMALAGAASVAGVDIIDGFLEEGRELARNHGVADRVTFFHGMADVRDKRFDRVVSLNSFEHFGDPEETLRDMTAVLHPGAAALISFGPPWFAPHGSHMHFFTKVPWVNIIFPESTVMKVRARYRNDGATRYEDVTSGLNRMSLKKFEALISGAGLSVADYRLRCVKNLHVLAGFPVIRELFVNRVIARLVSS